MGRNGKQRARVESADGVGAGGIHTTANNIGNRHHEGAIRRGGGEAVGWEGGGGWDTNGAGDATEWPNDEDDTWGIQPADSVSNVDNSNGAGWSTAAPAPPAKHIPINTTNGWGWDHAIAAPSPPSQSAHMPNQVRQGQHGTMAADSMAAQLLDALAQKQQAQQKELRRHQRQQEAQYLMQPQQYYQQPQQHSPHAMQLNHQQQQSKAVRHTGKHKRTEVSTVGSGGGWGGDGWVGNDEGAVANAAWGAGGGADAWNVTDHQNGGWAAATSTVTPGGFGAGGAWGVSNNIAGDAWAGSTENNGHAHAPGMVQSKSWGGWAQELETQSQQQLNTTPPDGKMPKVIVTSPSSVHTDAVLSPKRQSHSLSGFFGRAFKGGHGEKEKEKEKQQAHVQDENKRKMKTLKRQKFASPPATAWPEVIEEQEEGEEEGFEEEEEEEYGEDDYGDYDEYGQDNGLGKQGGWFADAGSGWDDAAFPMPSKAYALAAEGRVPPRRRAQSESHSADYRILNSRGDALAIAHRALYSKSRLARNRIHWLFDPGKDERVSSLLDWVQKMHYELAMFGFSKFLETRERGALFANADYRLPSSPNEPTFDWLTYDNVQTTMDRTLQESLAFYDPNTQVLVFVFLLSKSQNSMAIWRRKLVLPNNIRLTYGPQIAQATAGLRKNYPIHIDETPGAVPASADPPERSNSTKRRWFKWGRS